MLLIILLGVIAKLALVSGDCNFGNLTQNNFDWYNYTGPRPWYPLLHTSDVYENILYCVVNEYGRPAGSTILKTMEADVISDLLPIEINGIITNWMSNGCYDIIFSTVYASGQYCVVAVDYDRYAITKSCSVSINPPHVYVEYRSRQPDQGTVNDVLMKLQENNIDVSQLVEWNAVNCD